MITLLKAMVPPGSKLIRIQTCPNNAARKHTQIPLESWSRIHKYKQKTAPQLVHVITFTLVDTATLALGAQMLAVDDHRTV